MPTIVDRAREYDGFESDDQAADTVDAVLETLAERLSQGEAEDIAESLPGRYADEVRGPAPRHPQEYSVVEFLDRVEERADIEHGRREERVAAAMTAVADAVPDEEVARAREQLPDEYDRLFGADS
ncbi:MAG: DUF2267 domain-containing protein [Halobacterium sp.]